MKAQLTITHVATPGEAQHFLAAGFCPVECSFGEASVVDDLRMDHHGSLSHLEGVAVRAYRDHLGARASDPRFAVTGAADADATFAMAALAGMLPQPGTRPDTGTLSGLAALINRADTDPIGLRLGECNDGRKLLLFKRLSSGAQDATSFYAGIDRWRILLGPNPPVALLDAVGAEEQRRVTDARAAKSETIGPHVALVESEVWGYDVWYAELRPVIVAYQAGQGRVSIGCRDSATAQRIFGPFGLRRVFPTLEPPGWGGRETIGGSPRGVAISRSQAHAAALRVEALVTPQLFQA